ncbi:MAG: protein kinase [Myxococcales bacterium]|nr:protein kinase [Myxococcales bacterium]
MTPEQHEALSEHFAALCDLTPAEQAPHLRALRDADPELAQALAGLLGHDAALQADGGELATGAGLRALVTGTTTGDQSTSTAPTDVVRPGERVGDRYVIEARLGQGGGGQVFRARDTRTQEAVALKFLAASERTTPREVRRFRREFRAVSRLDHPHCLRVFSEGVHRDRRYIAMELLAGGDLERLARPATPAASARLLATLVQVAVALDYVHGRRIVHRDLKPANVLLTAHDPPAPKLADFGIARLWGDEVSRVTDGGLLGTLDYLSPEQIQGGAVDPRTDLYAFGCMIYTLWAGRPPYVGTAWQRLAARVTAPPPPLRTLAPEAPAGLEALALRLLAVDPAGRPPNALAVAEALSALIADGAAAAGLAATLADHESAGFLYPPAMVGREATRAALVDRAHAAIGGRAPTAVALVGEGGVGKTTLARAVGRAAEAAGVRVVALRTEPEAAAPLSPLGALLAALKPEDASPGWGEAILERHLPTRALQAGDAILARLAGELVERLQAAGPVLVILEDLHHAGASALALLEAVLARHGSAGGAAILGTLRPSAAVEGALPDLDRWPLAPLGPADVAAVAASMLATALPPGLAEALAAESGGNPLLVQSALRSRVSTGHLRRAGAAWRLAGEGPREARPLETRLQGLRPATRALLAAAALLGQRFDLDVLAAAVGLPEDDLADALDEAQRASVVRAASWQRGTLDVWEFEHARLVEVLGRSLPPEAARAHHAALAAALAERGATAARIAHHFVEAGLEVEAFRWLRQAAREAHAGFDYGAAVQLGEAALARVAVAPGEEPACREALADALMMAGQSERAGVILRALVPLQGVDSPGQSRLDDVRRLRKLGFALVRSGDTSAALQALRRALDALGHPLPAGRARLYLRLARDVVAVLWRRWRPRRRTADDPLVVEHALVQRELAMLHRWVDDERCAAHCLGAARAAARLAAPDLLVDAYTSVAILLAFAASARLGTWVEARAQAVAHAAGDRAGLGRVLLLRGMADIFLRNQPAAGLARLDEGVALYRETGDRYFTGWALTFRGWSALFTSRFEQAGLDFQVALDLARREGIGWMAADAACGLGMIQVIQGHLPAAEATVRGVLASDVRLALPAVEGAAHEVLGQVAFVQSRYRDAQAFFQRACALFAREHLEQSWGFVVRIELSEAIVWRWDAEGPGAVPEALDLLRENARVLTRHLKRLPLFAGAVPLLWATWHARAGRPARARQLMAEALRRRPPPRQTYTDAWLLWRTAFERARLGDPPEAVRPLLDELDALCARIGFLGLRPWLAEARGVFGL